MNGDERDTPAVPSVEGIKNLADLCQQRGVWSIEASDGDWSVRLELDQAATLATGIEPGEAEAAIEAPGLALVRSDWVGIFHRAEDSESAAFVLEGQRVASGDVIAVIEAMGLQHDQQAGQEGRIARFLVEDGTPVEYGQPLLEVE